MVIEMNCMKDENGVEWWTRTTLEAIQRDMEEAYRHGTQGGSYDWPGMGEVTITENGEAFLKPNLPMKYISIEIEHDLKQPPSPASCCSCAIQEEHEMED